jgi:hypothetical protein
MKIQLWLLVAVLLGGIFLESCRPPRCPIASCHIRMKHRHPSKDGEGGFNPDAGFDPSTGEALSASGSGKVYRGVPFWERNKDPKIAQGYKEGYKYRHRKQKPLTAAELKKIEEKRNREQEKMDRKARKNGSGEQATEEAPQQEGDAQTESVQESAPEGETKAQRRQRRKESRRKAKEENQENTETKPAEEAPRRQPPPKPAEDDKKDGF